MRVKRLPNIWEIAISRTADLPWRIGLMKRGQLSVGWKRFFPFLQGLTSGKIFIFFWKFRPFRQAMIAVYEFVARYRYHWFGASEEP